MKYAMILSLFATMSYGHLEPIIYKRTPLGDSVDKASMKILKETIECVVDKNVITSPLGALTLLSMYSAGTAERSKEEIMQLLGFTDYKKLEESYGSLTEKFSPIDPSYLMLANKMYMSNQYTLDSNFSDVTSRSYKSEVDTVVFKQKTATADRINKWVDEKTKGHLKSLIDEETIDEDAAVVFFNLIYFQGRWQVSFNSSETTYKSFYVNDSHTVKKPMMKLKQSLFYHEAKTIGARMVGLPYKEKGFRMIVVLPDEKDGLTEVVEKLTQKGILEDVFALQPATMDIVFEMPKFEIKNNIDLKKVLPKVGVSHLFTDVASLVRENPVYVSKAFQNAFVTVDEEGSTAGAVTGSVMQPMSAYHKAPTIEFKVGYPFMFAILHEDIVLFTGTYTH